MASATLDALRALMAAHSPPLDGLIVPSEDNHQSEYVSERDKRREFVSGFTGSAGLALVTMKEALLWTDGRYFLQATREMSDRWTLMRGGEDPATEIWISENLPAEAAVGVDPWSVSVDTARKWELAFTKNKQRLIQLSKNLVDEVWKDRPTENIRPVMVQPIEFAGRSVAEKLNDLRKKLEQEKVYGIIVSALDEVAWLYNVRGSDIPYNPVVHAFAIVTLQSAFFHVDKRKVSDEVRNHLAMDGIEVREYNELESDITFLASGQPFGSFSKKDSPNDYEKFEEYGLPVSANSGLSMHSEYEIEQNKHLIWTDPRSCCLAVYSKLGSDCGFLQQSPLALSKALKNPIELDGLRKAHIRDGAAVVQYLVWLDHQMQEIYGAAGYLFEPEGKRTRKNLETARLTEASVSDKLAQFRSKQENFRGLSFPTISSVGPNAAVIHYQPDAETCLELDADSMYLFDSGAQYQDGTTDITRAVHFGKPSAHEKACYTAVLRGHISLETATFPNGTTGHALDVLARVPLWKFGLDYRHGTGHGVGSYLNVHEGPHLISFRPQALNVTLQASMTVTDEPGYYEDGKFGIRLENVLIAKEADTKFNFDGKGYLSFENITWVPYQKKLMDISQLSPTEIEWVDNYHSTCREVLAPHLNEEEMHWLKKATEPIRA